MSYYKDVNAVVPYEKEELFCEVTLL